MERLLFLRQTRTCNPRGSPALVGPQGTEQGHRGEVAADPSLLRYIPEEPRAASISQTSYGLSWTIGEVEVQHRAGVRQRRNYNPQSGKRPGL